MRAHVKAARPAMTSPRLFVSSAPLHQPQQPRLNSILSPACSHPHSASRHNSRTIAVPTKHALDWALMPVIVRAHRTCRRITGGCCRVAAPSIQLWAVLPSTACPNDHRGSKLPKSQKMTRHTPTSASFLVLQVILGTSDRNDDTDRKLRTM